MIDIGIQSQTIATIPGAGAMLQDKPVSLRLRRMTAATIHVDA